MTPGQCRCASPVPRCAIRAAPWDCRTRSVVSVERQRIAVTRAGSMFRDKCPEICWRDRIPLRRRRRLTSTHGSSPASPATSSSKLVKARRGHRVAGCGARADGAAAPGSPSNPSSGGFRSVSGVQFLVGDFTATPARRYPRKTEPGSQLPRGRRHRTGIGIHRVGNRA